MSPLWPATALVLAAVIAAVGARRGLRHPETEVLRANHAGVSIPLHLGRALAISAQIATSASLTLAALAGPVPEWRVPLLVVIGALLLHLVGRADDRRDHGPRGLGGHVGSLFRGRVTTGILKLVVGVTAAMFLAMEVGGGVLRVVVATLVIALSVNVTNALDVRPGRALKWALLILTVVVVAAWGGGVVLVEAAYLGAGLVVLPFDLRERAMLGDAGSNPLGLVVGAGLAAVLPLWGLLVALVILAGLQIAADTVTISRLIEAVPPLRWFDRLGRRN
jgi:UDP-GlcNAc:undecaprenyl-phosphate/decaprenyl-phosphate GlcNAc-1-phosphate transferase